MTRFSSIDAEQDFQKLVRQIQAFQRRNTKESPIVKMTKQPLPVRVWVFRIASSGLCGGLGYVLYKLIVL